MSCNPMLVINSNLNSYKNTDSQKGRRYRTNQAEFNFNAEIGSHNIYSTELVRIPDGLRKVDDFKRSDKLRKPVKTVKFNKLGSSNILTFPRSKLKSFYKNESGTFIVVEGFSDPIAVRDSLSEISNIIN